MSKKKWDAVDQYIIKKLVDSDPALEETLEMSRAADLPTIQVAPNQGKLLNILARAIGARNILEIGTLGGYSTIWLARALPVDGALITLEIDPKHAKIAQSNLLHANLNSLVEIIQGPALDSLKKLFEEERGPFDLIFIDADKEGYPEYFEWVLKLSIPGTLIVADNVIRNGEVTNASSEDDRVHGVRRFMDLLSSEKSVTATAIQTVGSKGYDGFAIALVINDS